MSILSALKMLAFFNAEQLKCFSPKMLKVVHKRLFTKPSTFVDRKEIILYFIRVGDGARIVKHQDRKPFCLHGFY